MWVHEGLSCCGAGEQFGDDGGAGFACENDSENSNEVGVSPFANLNGNPEIAICHADRESYEEKIVPQHACRGAMGEIPHQGP